MIRVLIVDDSPTARQLIAGILSRDSEIDVVGHAVCGEDAVHMAAKLRPDVLTMDLHMPGMNGIEATKQIMIECPTPIVIVSASTAIHEVATAMQALRAGALTLLLKPPSPDGPEFDPAACELIETVKTMADVKVVRHLRSRATVRPTAMTKFETASKHQVIAIAASTGGPAAICELLSGLPKDFTVPIALVQHIASGFLDGFATWLNSSVPLSVGVARNNEIMKAGHVYVAPEDRHLGVVRGGQLVVRNTEPIGGFRPSASFLFDSVAKEFGGRTVGVILTGMGQDGVEGLRTLRGAGGHVVAQDEASSVVYGMPRAVVLEGLASAVLPLDKIAKYIVNLVT